MNPVGYIGLDAAQRLETINIGLPTTITKHRAFDDDVELWVGGWRPIETAPIDEWILIAATPDHVGQAIVYDDADINGNGGEARFYEWANNRPFHPNIKPTHWMPLPKHPEAT